MWVGLGIWEDCHVRIKERLSVGWFGRIRLGMPVINQSIHWVMVFRLLLWNELSVVVVGLDV
jgi:hypothetical protein